jgi:hypothetical protein
MQTTLKTLKVQGDGHCLYRAIMQSFADGMLTKPQENAAAREFRDAVTRYICTHPNKFKRLFIQERKEDDYLSRRFRSFEEYCIAARHPRSNLYGGRLDLQAAADILHAKIMIHWPKTKTRPHETPVLTFEPSVLSVRLNNPSSIRVQKSTDDHYDAIVVRETPIRKKRKRKSKKRYT